MANRRPSRQKDKKKKKKAGITGCSTLNQVAGVPKPREYRSSIPVENPGTIREPHLICSMCGKEIENIASALTSPDGGYVHFDCVLNAIKETEHPGEGETVSYIGSGNFAVIGKDEDGKPVILRRIPYETGDRLKAMKEYVSSLRS